MRCYVCGQGELKERRESIPYRALPGVVLDDIQVQTCTVCGERFESIPAMASLNRELAKALVRKRARLTPEEIRFLRKSVGWSARELSEHLRVDPSTVSRWESGKQSPSPQLDLLIRFVVQNADPMEPFDDREAGRAEPEPLAEHFQHGESWVRARTG